MEKVRIGTISCGDIAINKHLPAQIKNPDAELVAFCDIVKEKAEFAAKTFGKEGAKIYTDYKDLLADDNVDAVLILTPNYLHCQMTVDALNAGKHVLCEKPMAMNYAEAQKMIDARARSGKILTIGYQNRYRKDVLYVTELVRRGELGEIYYAQANAIRRRGVPTWGVFTEEEKQGGGPLIDIGTHALDMALFIMNNYKPKYCAGKTFHKLNRQTETGNAFGDWDIEKFTTEDSAFGFIVMENGAVINLRASWALNTTHVHEACAMFCGDKAGAEIMDSYSNKICINGVSNGKLYTIEPDVSAGEAPLFKGANHPEPAELEAVTFTNAILKKGDLYVTAEQAAVVTRILEGIYISEKTGKAYYFD